MGKKRKRLPEKQSLFVEEFRPRTLKQAELTKLIEQKEIVVCTGPAGTGKTFVTLSTALSMLGEKYKSIMLIKSLTTIPGEALGFIPGSVNEKMDPYIMSYTWNIDKILGQKGGAKSLMAKGLIELMPLAFIRGISIDNTIVIIDETQNIDKHTFKTIISRIGEDSKYVFLGDIEQIDRRNKHESCLLDAINIFRDSDLIGTVEFEDSDCVRNPIIPKILEELRQNMS